MIEVIIPGKPMSQKRHRDSKNGGKYDPSKQDKKRIRNFFLPHKPTEPLECLLKVDIYAFFRTPTSWSGVKKKRSEGKYRPKTPDVDNIEKIIYDALNKYIYVDDSQIVRSVTEKYYSVQPCTVIKIESIQQDKI